MDYGDITDSVIPHVANLGTDFRINYQDYKLSLVMEISFIVVVLPFLIIWIYFASKYKKKYDKTLQENKSKEKNSISGDQAKSQFIASEQISINQPNNKTAMQNQYEMERINVKTETKAKIILQQIDHRICYLCPFLIAHLLVINSFDTGYLSVATFHTTILLYAIFNLRKPCKKVFFLNLFIVPCLVSFIEYFIGDHKLGEHIR